MFEVGDRVIVTAGGMFEGWLGKVGSVNPGEVFDDGQARYGVEFDRADFPGRYGFRENELKAAA